MQKMSEERRERAKVYEPCVVGGHKGKLACAAHVESNARKGVVGGRAKDVDAALCGNKAVDGVFDSGAAENTVDYGIHSLVDTAVDGIVP